MPRIRFFQELERYADLLFDDDEEGPLFGLVLGAGASRSAGIPVTVEMVELLEQQIKFMWPTWPVDETPRRFSDLISLLYEISGEWDVRHFLRLCIRRGSREPNLTHLISANLACLGIFNPIITTNFDDLTLASFWSLPYNVAYSEPFVIYDPRTTHLKQASLGEETPVIIKAHGHHTQYGMGIIENRVRALAPSVKAIMRIFGAPRVGYIVAGYSGSWPDGIMEALKDERLTRNKVIYWFHRSRLPRFEDLPGPLRELIERSDVRFVQSDDLDYLFMRISGVMNDTMPGSAWLLNGIDLFTSPTTHERLVARDLLRAYQQKGRKRWWTQRRGRHRVYARPSEVERADPKDLARFRFGTRAEARRDMGIPALRQTLLPILRDIERWDKESFMPYECLPDRLKPKFDTMGVLKELEGEAPGIEKLREAISPRISWTRRNRHLLRIALEPHTEPIVSHDLLSAIDALIKV
jgi:hypothetical protein